VPWKSDDRECLVGGQLRFLRSDACTLNSDTPFGGQVTTSSELFFLLLSQRKPTGVGAAETERMNINCRNKERIVQ
jgi:hypothetical protein